MTHSMRDKGHCGIETGCGYYNDGVGVVTIMMVWVCMVSILVVYRLWM